MSLLNASHHHQPPPPPHLAPPLRTPYLPPLRPPAPPPVPARPPATHSFHAVLDYDYEDEGAEARDQRGPIVVKNGTVPVVPLYSYPALDNGTLVQIPILWTALSLALGLEIRGEVIRGVPCIKRFHQLFCPTAGNSYPIDRIELFIDENKALMKRMYGEFQMNEEYGPPAQEVFESPHRNGPLKRRSAVKREVPDVNAEPVEQQGKPRVSSTRFPRQSSFSRGNQSRETGRVDACESKVEIVTPYWASNSAGKIRAIVNTQHFEQAIHQEVCSKVQTIRCSGDCGCEQKYKWHRLLAYDPDNDCKGIFMDWFLFPSCCVCRCSPIDDH